MIRKVFSLAILFASFGYAHAQNGMSVTPGKIVKWLDPFGDLTDSQIYEDPSSGNIGIGTTKSNWCPRRYSIFRRRYVVVILDRRTALAIELTPLGKPGYDTPRGRHSSLDNRRRERRYRDD